MNMNKIRHRGVSPHTDMVAALGDDAPVFSSAVQKWAGEFKRGSESLENDTRPGRPDKKKHRSCSPHGNE